MSLGIRHEKLPMVLACFLLPLAGWVYLRALDKEFRLELLLLPVLYLSTNWRFSQGVFAYPMGNSTTLFDLAALELRRKRESGLWSIVFLLAISLCSLMHLASFVVLIGLWWVGLCKSSLYLRRHLQKSPGGKALKQMGQRRKRG
jgi:hypothetical protein